MARFVLLLYAVCLISIHNEYCITTTNCYCNGFTTKAVPSSLLFVSLKRQQHATIATRKDHSSCCPLQQQQQQQQQKYKQQQYILQHYSTTLPTENEQIEMQQVNGEVGEATTSSSSTLFMSNNTDSNTESSSSVIMGWECTDDVSSCVEVPICVVDDTNTISNIDTDDNDDETCSTKSTSLDVRIHNVWYDVSGWRKHHPAGTHWIDYYQGRDATEVMDGFHTIKAQEMYKRLPKSKSIIQNQLQQNIPNDTQTQLNFRKLRKELEENGYWERNMVHEYQQLGIWSSLVIGASVLAHLPMYSAISTIVYPIVSCILLAFSMTAAGWLGHDYIHGIDPFANKLRNFAAIAAGLAPIWWSDKHNKVQINKNCSGVRSFINIIKLKYCYYFSFLNVL
jgi:cytochrome b involved in lipid metabolism